MAAAPDMTVDELARESGTTTRNVRAYQTKGLLPPPRVVGRVGYYGADHLARLKDIDRLQERGFSLAAIRDLLSAKDEGKSLDDVLGFEAVLRAPWSEEVPQRFTRASLEERFPELVHDDSQLRRAVTLGLLVERGEGYEAPSPELIRVGAELVAAGVPLAATLDEYERLAGDLAGIADRLVSLFENHVWEPFAAAGFPAAELPRVTDVLQRMRPLASASVVAELARAMERATSESLARQTAKFMPAGKG